MSRHLPESNDQETMSICDICLRNQERHVNFTTCGELWAKFSNLRENSEEKLHHHAARDTNLEDQSASLWLDDFDISGASMIDSKATDSFLANTNHAAWGVVGAVNDEGLGRDDVWTGVFQDWSLDDEPANREEHGHLNLPFDDLATL